MIAATNRVVRFINRDPIEEAGGINLYGFCGNDGVNGFDVMGNSWLSVALGDIGKAFSDVGHAASHAWDKVHNTFIEAALCVIPYVGNVRNLADFQ